MTRNLTNVGSPEFEAFKNSYMQCKKKLELDVLHNNKKQEVIN